MDLHRFGMDFSDSGAWVPGGLWHPVAACGAPRQQAAAPIQNILSPWGRQAVRMVAGWMTGWLDGWMEVVGITTVT